MERKSRIRVKMIKVFRNTWEDGIASVEISVSGRLDLEQGGMK